MLCLKCKGDTEIVKTQTDQTNQPVPINFRTLNLVRRRRRCLKDETHLFWTIELSEEFLESIMEKGA